MLLSIKTKSLIKQKTLLRNKKSSRRTITALMLQYIIQFVKNQMQFMQRHGDLLGRFFGIKKANVKLGLNGYIGIEKGNT